ncbi:helix-turn-helix domain-containing protein [Pseudoalteromonas xiamenensis]|uniref:Helix-turn-helix transcriptional regulator n=1 Tax=Pseudoalteromonas xiamenensis TaxID=882626 RepID=A0A975HP67_9GAMM|nr:helix-turn-helix transcriptional regulator [Pseudoalteromonas xiamenensis]QTH72955.1 helix-turn-helix transcriptional regulator [Pseudoalteromonas xiamenensis]
MKISNSMSDGAIAAEVFSRLESRRKELNLTQEELAFRVGINSIFWVPRKAKSTPQGALKNAQVRNIGENFITNTVA